MTLADKVEKLDREVEVLRATLKWLTDHPLSQRDTAFLRGISESKVKRLKDNPKWATAFTPSGKVDLPEFVRLEYEVGL